MDISAAEARELLTSREIWIWYYLHPDWQWEQSRHWHEDRYAVAIDEALDLMTQDSEFSFYFDTTSEFYSAVEQRLGSRLDELKQRVREGRVRIVSGQVANCRPTQVGDETYIRNLQLGRAYFEHHLPTSDLSLFHSVDIAIGGSQMPQILSLAGMKFYRAWRPHGPMNLLGIPHQFIWKGIDGSRILVTRGAYGTSWRGDSPAVRYEDDWDAAVAWLYENAFHDQIIQDRSPTDHLWAIQGYDDARPMTTVHADQPFDVLGLMAEWRRREDIPIRWCTPLEYSQAVEAQQERLAVIEGVLDGCDVAYNMANHGANGLWVWRQMNDRRLLRAESWAAAAASVGFAYPQDHLRELWYQHCTYQAHAQDAAFEDDWNYLVDRARNVKYRAAQIESDALQTIVTAAGGGSRTTRYIFNPSPWPRRADVEIYHPCAKAGVESLEVVDAAGQPLPQQQLAEFRHPRFGGSLNDERRLVRVELPPMGYRRLEVVESASAAAPRPPEPPDGVIETPDLVLTYRHNALRQVRDVASGSTYYSRDGSAWPGLFFHVLQPQDWVFGGPEIRRERFASVSGEWLQTGPMRWLHRSHGTLGPYDVTLDTMVANHGRDLQVSARLEGHWEEPPLTGFVTLLADVEAGGAITVDTPFAVEARDPDHDVYVDNVPTDQDYGIDSMFERLRPGVFWARSWSDWSGDRQGLSLISVDGNYYWLKEPHQFGHILLRCMTAAPGTWMQFCPKTWTGAGVHTFRYALRFHDGDWRNADPQRHSLELRQPPLVARADFLSDASLPRDSHSFLRLDGPGILSAYYPAGDDVYVRIYESRGEGGEVTLALDWAPESVEAVDFLGRTVDVPIDVHDRTINITARPWQIITLRLARR